jgi:yeast amino acid transporter
LTLFTFLTMVGANPERDAYGFRYWNNPGAFASYMEPGGTGRLIGFCFAVIQAGFTICGPEYISMAAGEVKNPRKSLPQAYRTMSYRFAAFFIGGALCVGIICPYNDPTLVAIYFGSQGGGGTGAASPYVIGMDRWNIPVLPHITNALILTSILSAGNSYVYCSSRSLFGLALDGKAPKIFTKCTKAGVPIYCVLLTLAISCLAFLQVSSSSAVVLNW